MQKEHWGCDATNGPDFQPPRAWTEEGHSPRVAVQKKSNMTEIWTFEGWLEWVNMSDLIIEWLMKSKRQIQVTRKIVFQLI